MIVNWSLNFLSDEAFIISPVCWREINNIKLVFKAKIWAYDRVASRDHIQ